jgi:hypothetical protein
VVDLDDEEEGPVHLEHDVRLQVGKAGAVFTKLYFLRNLQIGPISRRVHFWQAFPA